MKLLVGRDNFVLVVQQLTGSSWGSGNNYGHVTRPRFEPGRNIPDRSPGGFVHQLEGEMVRFAAAVNSCHELEGKFIEANVV